jgi:hypothetical protein
MALSRAGKRLEKFVKVESFMQKSPDKFLGIFMILSTVLVTPLLTRLLRGIGYASMYLMTLLDNFVLSFSPEYIFYVDIPKLLFLALPGFPLVIAYLCKRWAPFAWPFVLVVILLVLNIFHLVMETPGFDTRSHGSYLVSLFVGIYGTIFCLIVVGAELLLRLTIWCFSKPKLDTPNVTPDAVA